MSGIEVLSAVHGIAPRSDELLKLGGDLERGRVSRTAYEDLLDQESADWLALQTAVGIDLKEDGKLRWQDHLRPIVKATDGFAPDVDDASVTRWFETNTFYRKPIIVDSLRLHAERLAELTDSEHDYTSLLAPASFAALCDNRTALPAHVQVAKLYNELFSYLSNRGTTDVFLEEAISLFPLDPSPVEWVSRLAQAYPNIRVGYIQREQSTTVIPRSLPHNLNVAVSPETLRHFRSIPPAYRPQLTGHDLWQPIVDAATTLPDVVDVARWPEDILRAVQPARLVLTHTVDLEQLPLAWAREKVKRLGELAVNLGEHLESTL